MKISFFLCTKSILSGIILNMNIGNISVRNNIFLAPMAGITDAAFRSVCFEMGSGLNYTEMVSARGIYYNDVKTRELLKKGKAEEYYAIQIFGNEPHIISYAVKYASQYQPLLIDINMGCPTPKIVRNHDGSYLMKDPLLAGRIVESAVKSTDIPVSVKIRSGFDRQNINAAEVAQAAEQAGAAMIAVHPRTRDMYYGGEADWEIIRQVKERVRIPVIGNGDIHTPGDITRMLEFTGCDAVMIGREARGNPWVFENALRHMDRLAPREITLEEKISVIARHMELMIELKGENTAVLEMRKHAAWYIRGEKNAARVKKNIYEAKSSNEILGYLEELG
jgi:tRNA-dihydrouridine synthase B